MKKPKPPKTFQEVDSYIREKKLNVSPKAFWDFFEAGDWHDSEGKPVLCWKQKVLTWHYRDKRTIAAEKASKATNKDVEVYRQRIRNDYEDYLNAKTTQALIDEKNDGGQLSKLCGWLIDEIISKRESKDGKDTNRPG